ncbi:Uncharacterized protein dnm_017070 [Desulfonema magnum]|uniref:Uncharacterized protein n=1 Tax=Desulfonema magnum TaxID=45655 RepID=A0A975GMC1_9BACT|nr:Uncharacterized protein dnm_017070 [Desulfonema magnum]
MKNPINFINQYIMTCQDIANQVSVQMFHERRRNPAFSFIGDASFRKKSRVSSLCRY